MADEIVLKTFAASTIAPVDDAVIQEVYTGDGGIISGATVTIKDANTLHITGGYGAICGREFQIFASDIPVVLSSSGNLNGRLYIHMDLSQSTNPIQLLTEVAASLTPCVQDADVNLTNGIFEINLATFTVGTSAISGLADVAPKLVGIESSDLTSIKAVGSTNATGSTITKATYFYLNGKLCLAKSDIASGATFTLNTNYEVVTAGGLNSLNSALTPVPFTLNGVSGVTIDSNQTKCYKIGHIVVITALFTLTSATTAKTYTFASVPNEYKPRNVYACFAADNTNDIPVSGMVSDDGNVKMYRNGTQSATSFRLSATYVIN